jgi:hypothetical protein
VLRSSTTPSILLSVNPSEERSPIALSLLPKGRWREALLSCHLCHHFCLLLEHAKNLHLLLLCGWVLHGATEAALAHHAILHYAILRSHQIPLYLLAPWPLWWFPR